jgi:hypothetical protein
VTLSDGIGHLERYAYFSQSQNRIVWPFGEHAIAPFYTFDVKTRQSLLQQSGVFLKQTGDFPTTIEDLRQQLQDPASKSKILKQMGRCVHPMIYMILMMQHVLFFTFVALINLLTQVCRQFAGNARLLAKPER